MNNQNEDPINIFIFLISMVLAAIALKKKAEK
jgi:hypothetical protein